jgi:hypothetical protein
MLQFRMQKRLTRIGKDIVNVELETDDGCCIPAQYQDLLNPSEIQGLCGRMQQDWELSHCTFHGIQMVFVRKSGSSTKCVGRAWEEMTGYPAMKNQTKCVDLQNLGKSQ